MTVETLALVTLTALFAALAWIGQRRHRDAVRTARATMFDACTDLLDEARLEQDDIDFPRLEGHYRGHRVRVQPIADHVGFRKVPSLWLLVTVYGKLPVPAVVAYLARPQQVEFFSPTSRLAVTLPVPAEWPAHALLRSDNAAGADMLVALSPHMAWFRDDPRAKEIVLSPNGVRLVFQAQQARRTQYLVLRGVTFEKLAVCPAELAAVLDRALAIRASCLEDASHAAGTRVERAA